MLQDCLTPSQTTAESRPDFVIETERLTLRRPTHADVPAIARLANDRRISEMTRRLPFPFHREHAAAFVAALPLLEQRDRARAYLIEHLGEPIGCISVEGSDTPELGYWLGVDAWGRGFATEAARAVVDAAFETRPIAHIAATARIANPASRNVLEKCGFVWQGCALQRLDLLGYSVPVDRLLLTREAWSALVP